MAQSAYSGSARKQISRHVKKHKKEGMPQDQAVAAAMSEARRSGKKVPKRKSGGRTKANRKRPGTRAKASKASRKAGRKSGGGRKKAGGSSAQKRRAGAKGGRATARKGR